jgi:5'-nucleotidase
MQFPISNFQFLMNWHENASYITGIMKILITNDDSIYSPGIMALAKAAQHFGDVNVVAPDVEQSSMGHAVTHSRPISLKKSPILFEGMEAWRVNGTPGDCVALGTHIYNKTDLVLSGINLGYNLGNSMWHSGTLAGAKQGVLLGIKSIAFSTTVPKDGPDFTALAPHVQEALKMLIEDAAFGLYNVNIPPNPKGVKWTRQSVRQYDGKIVPGVDPMGRKHYWFTIIPLEPAEEGTDRWAIEHDFVSITPLRLDLTNEKMLKDILNRAPVESKS